MVSILINILLAIHVIVSLLIILVVLMQRPKNEGLGAAFGGGMTENLFGAQTTNVLANFTRWLGGIFFVLTVSLSILYAKQTDEGSDLRKELMSSPAAAVETVPKGEEAEMAAPEASPEASPGETVPATDASDITPTPAAETPATETPAPAAGSPAPVTSPAPAASPAS